MHSFPRVFLSNVENFELLSSGELDVPYKALLAHDGLLTPKLAEYFGQRIALRVLDKKVRGSILWRSVHLVLEKSGQVVVYAEIQIDLSLVPADLALEVVSDVKPLGELLQRGGIECTSIPTLFRLGVMGDDGPRDLYGRSSAVMGPDGVVARSIEIVAPIPDAIAMRATTGA